MLLATSPARLEHAVGLVDLGAALRRNNRRSQARARLSLGLDLADACGASVLADRAREELAMLGFRPRRSQLTGLGALTASERRVAQLAADGLGNVEIAQTLFVTRKTVEKHLGNVYAKLGVTSRAALPAVFGRASAMPGPSPREQFDLHQKHDGERYNVAGTSRQEPPGLWRQARR